MMKDRRFFQPVITLLFAAALCILLASCSGGTPFSVHNQAGCDLSISISVSRNDKFTTLLNNYVLAVDSDTNVSIPRNVSSGDWHIYIMDDHSKGYTFCDFSTGSLGENASVSIRYEKDILVLDMNWGDGSISTIYPATSAQVQGYEYRLRYERGEVSYQDYMAQDFWLKYRGGNPRKWDLIFGSDREICYDTQEQAVQHMTRITVPVWKLSNGTKVPSTASFYINAALASDVVEIFTEIYNDPEQFPIKDVGGYSWRGDNSSSEHNPGLAIDINPNENYQIRSGNIVVGSFWDPQNSPYSIPEDGSVVRIFAAHGWSWGGDAFADSTDPSSGHHDYMHFSYFGT